MSKMAKINRRKFIYSTAMIASIPGVITTFGSETIGRFEEINYSS
jgi:hypothetical protein